MERAGGFSRRDWFVLLHLRLGWVVAYLTTCGDRAALALFDFAGGIFGDAGGPRASLYARDVSRGDCFCGSRTGAPGNRAATIPLEEFMRAENRSCGTACARARKATQSHCGLQAGHFAPDISWLQPASAAHPRSEGPRCVRGIAYD